MTSPKDGFHHHLPFTIFPMRFFTFLFLHLDPRSEPRHGKNYRHDIPKYRDISFLGEGTVPAFLFEFFLTACFIDITFRSLKKSCLASALLYQ